MTLPPSFAPAGPSASSPDLPAPAPGPSAGGGRSPALTVARDLAHGIGQVFFQPHAVTGLLIVVGIATYSPLMALEVVLGTAVGTGATALVGLPTAQGLAGYNGALVGAASWATTGRPWPAALATVVGAAACPAVTRALAALLERGRLPVLTAPFCVTSGLIAMLAGSMVPTAGRPESAAAHPAAVLGFCRSVLTGLGQVVLAESWLTGLLILTGLFVAGWRVGVAGLVGSLVGTVMTVATTGLTGAENGLGGYSPALTAIALAAVFLPHGRLAWGLGVVGAVATVLVSWVFEVLPVPTYTWPFVVTTWALLTLAGRWHARTGA